MRKGLFIGGIILTVIGGLILLLSAIGVGGANVVQSTTIPAYGGALAITINTIGNGQLAVGWSGGNSATTVELHTCSNSCQTIGTLLASGNGASNSFSVTVPPGTYAVLQPVGSGTASTALNGQLEVTGLTLLLVLGIAIMAIGVILWVWGALAKGKERAVESAEPQEESFSLRSSLAPDTTMEPAPDRAAAATPDAVPDKWAVVYRADPPPPPRFATSDAPTAVQSPMAGMQAKGSVKCAYCGTMNEPWIINCRNCKRPLSTTG